MPNIRIDGPDGPEEVHLTHEENPHWIPPPPRKTRAGGPLPSLMEILTGTIAYLCWRDSQPMLAVILGLAALGQWLLRGVISNLEHEMIPKFHLLQPMRRARAWLVAIAVLLMVFAFVRR